MRRHPSVSIGMPVYNGEPFFQEAVESLLAQDHDDLELIISDNASNDGTGARCERFQAEDQRIRYHRSGRNKGPGINFARVLHLSRGDYFMWASADDLWDPSFVSSMVRLLRDHDDAVVAFSGYDNIDEHGQRNRSFDPTVEWTTMDRLDRLRSYLELEEFLGKCNAIYGLMRRRVAIDAFSRGPFDIQGWGWDYHFVFAVLFHGPLVLSPDCLFHKRWPAPTHSQSHLVRFVKRHQQVLFSLTERLEHFQIYEEIVQALDALSPDEQAALNVVCRRRRNEYLRHSVLGPAREFRTVLSRKLRD